MFEKLKGSPSYAKETNEAIRRLEYIISKLSENLINVFRMDSEEGAQDIEPNILKAFLNCLLLFFVVVFFIKFIKKTNP
jgi:hypothetical protein